MDDHSTQHTGGPFQYNLAIISALILERALLDKKNTTLNSLCYSITTNKQPETILKKASENKRGWYNCGVSFQHLINLLILTQVL